MIENNTENINPSNANVKAALIHILGDFIQSLGVLIAALLIRFYQFYLADPLCTYFFSLIVLCTTLPLLNDIAQILMEGTVMIF